LCVERGTFKAGVFEELQLDEILIVGLGSFLHGAVAVHVHVHVVGVASNATLYSTE
jgi:hypothetical protein